MTHLLGTGCYSPHHWECSAGGASGGGYFPAHFSVREKNSEHSSNVSQPLWKTSMFFARGHSGPVAQNPPPLNDCARPERWNKDKLRLQFTTRRVINSPACSKIFHTRGVYIYLHLNISTFFKVTWLWLEDEWVDWSVVCLFRKAQSCKLFALQASCALWENSHMVVSCLADRGVWRWVCVHWETAWRGLPCSRSPAPCTCQCDKSQQLQ